MRAKYSTGARGRALFRDEEAVEQVGSQVEEEAERPAAATAVRLADDGFVDFLLAGAQAEGEFRCADCRYGAVIQRALPICPMCGSTIWECRPARGSRLVD